MATQSSTTGRPRRRARRWLLVGLVLAALAGLLLALTPRLRTAPDPPPSSLVTTQDGMVLLPGGSFRMGDDFSPQADERPAHDVFVDPFWIDEHAVTNRQFAQFVQQTRFVTTAERQGWAYVFDRRQKQWVKRQGADWRHPGGPDTRLDGREAFPVVQVSWHDAAAYAAWAGKLLPSEAQWEYAARGGLRDTTYPWDHGETLEGRSPANTWQGWFPDENLGTDGFYGLAPVGLFPPNRFGVFDAAGNAWQWCSDWYSEDTYRHSAVENPRGPNVGQWRVVRGGSYLSAATPQAEYRCAARSKRPPDACYADLGFRCVRPAPSDHH